MTHCTLPFTQFDVQDKVFFPCCGAWCNYYTVTESSIKAAWESEKMQEFRRAVLDGTYKYCSDVCPLKGIFKPLTQNNKADGLGYGDERLLPKLTSIKVCSDYTCNLRCVMCRDKLIVTDPGIVVDQLNQIRDEFGDSLEILELSGCGDPIASKPVLRWLQNFDKKLFPKLQCIRLDTNMQLLTPGLWKTLENVKSYLKHFNISIDAATKETYEKIRRGGNWEKLVDNCKYLTDNIDVQEYHISFCICKYNLHEIEGFYHFCKEMFPNNLTQILYQEVLWFPERVSEPGFKKIASFTEEDIKTIIRQLDKIKDDKIVRIQTDTFRYE